MYFVCCIAFFLLNHIVPAFKLDSTVAVHVTSSYIISVPPAVIPPIPTTKPQLTLTQTVLAVVALGMIILGFVLLCAVIIRCTRSRRQTALIN